MFGISGTEQEIIFKVNEYARTADSVIKSLQNKLFAPYASHVAITNEVEIATDPVDLLLMIFDDRYHKKARFEAKRTLILMNLAGSIDQRERETDIEKKFKKAYCPEGQAEDNPILEYCKYIVFELFS